MATLYRSSTSDSFRELRIGHARNDYDNGQLVDDAQLQGSGLGGYE